jgi:hypothetical protein
MVTRGQKGEEKMELRELGEFERAVFSLEYCRSMQEKIHNLRGSMGGIAVDTDRLAVRWQRYNRLYESYRAKIVWACRLLDEMAFLYGDHQQTGEGEEKE